MGAYYLPTATTATLAALGAASLFVGRAHVVQTNQKFTWSPASTATADGFTIIAASGVTTGRWVLESLNLPSSSGGSFNSSDIGDVIWGVGGDSNAVGQAYILDPLIDVPNASRIWQYPYGSATGSTANTRSPANDPLNYGGALVANRIGPVMAFARALVQTLPLHRSLLLVTCARSGTGYFDSSWCAGENPAQSHTVVTGTAIVGEILTFKGTVTATLVSGAPGAGEMQFSSDAPTLAANLYAFINTNTVALGTNAANLSGAEFDIVYNSNGVAGNGYTLATSGSGFTFGGQRPSVLVGGSDSPGGTDLVRLVSQMNAAIALNPNNRAGGVIFSGGTNDSKMSATRWQINVQNMMAYIRANVTGGTNLNVIFLPMVPEWVNGNAQIMPIDLVMKAIPSNVAHTAYVTGALGSDNQNHGDSIFHWSATPTRDNGTRAALIAVPFATANTSPSGYNRVGQTQIVSGVASSSTTTGDLVVAGGAGVGGNLNVGSVAKSVTVIATSSIQAPTIVEPTLAFGYISLNQAGLLMVNRGGAAATGLTIQGAAAQSGPLFAGNVNGGASVFSFSATGALTTASVNGNTITAGTGTLTLGSVTLNAGAGGTLGSNAFTSTAYAPLASPTFTNPTLGVALGTSLGLTGELTFSTANSGVTLKQGANGRVGTFVLTGATPVTVNNTSIAITDCLTFSLNTVGGTRGVQPTMMTITAGSGFTVVGTALDTSTFNYSITKSAA